MLGVCLKYEQNNYGSKLQALATVKMFEKLGLEYEIIRYNKKTLSFYLKSIPRIFNIVFLNDRYTELQRKIQFNKRPEVKKNILKRKSEFEKFDRYFIEHLSEFYSSYEELKNICGKKYEAVITCSDQLWSPAALHSGFYNLMFVPDNTKKISWASSFGVKKIPNNQLKKTKKYLSRIDYISMRENSGAEIVKELTNKVVPVLMDPVFVFDKSDWAKMIPYQQLVNEPYVFCYFLGTNIEHRKEAIKFAKKFNLKIVTLKHLDSYVDYDEKFGDYAPYEVSPEDFLNYIRGAEYIFTDSFHGTAFSIIEEKQFVVFNRYTEKSKNSKNSRIDSVCKNLGLENRRWDGNKKTIFYIVKEKIEYNETTSLANVYRKKTIEYLNVLREI